MMGTPSYLNAEQRQEKFQLHEKGDFGSRQLFPKRGFGPTTDESPFSSQQNPHYNSNKGDKRSGV